MAKDHTPKTTLDTAREFLGKEVHVVFDRPFGSLHPEYGFTYEVNYGYVPGVMAADGEELDAYFLGFHESLKETDGICIAIIHRENDEDDKLIVAPKGMNFSDDEIRKVTNFQEQWFKSVIVRE